VDQPCQRRILDFVDVMKNAEYLPKSLKSYFLLGVEADGFDKEKKYYVKISTGST